MRRVIRNLLPPLFMDWLRGGRTYPSWDAAAAASSTFSDENLNRFKIARGKTRPYDGSLLRTNVLYLTALTVQKDRIRITDFGGSDGDLALDILQALPNVDYSIVENPTMVAMMAGETKIRFVSDIPNECDIFFTSGTMQCISDPLPVLERGFASAGQAVILARNCFCDTDIFRVHHSRLYSNGNGPIPKGFKNIKVSYPHRTLQESRVHDIAARNGFRCVARIGEESGLLRLNGMVYGAQLVFLRN